MTNTTQTNGSAPRRHARVAALTLAMVAMPAIFAAPLAQGQTYQGQTYTVIHSFSGAGGDGAAPMAGLLLSPTGNLFGTTIAGGADDFGAVFRLDTSNILTVVHSLNGVPEGAYPVAGLIRDSAGNFYGTAKLEGGGCDCGTVFKLSKGTLTVLHTFSGPDGIFPSSSLLRDSAGNLYGTTFEGGAFNHGTLFKLDTTGTFTLLHSFGAGKDGKRPYAGLVQDGSGNAYATTYYGGTSGQGTIYKLNLATGKYATLYSFPGPPGGASPTAGLIRDSADNLYGATYIGGDNNNGTIFKFDRRNSTAAVLYSFPGPGGRGPEGEYPYGGLVRDSAGNLYGTTVSGGTYKDGTVFKLDTTGTLTVLHHFGAFSGDGTIPYAGLVLDSAGNLFGTTMQGGAYGEGTIFKLTP
jgi:uncharacterized repeat protein (TIGR03803 family)